jgi:ABC-type multidrug transport system ATPase subunit
LPLLNERSNGAVKFLRGNGIHSFAWWGGHYCFGLSIVAILISLFTGLIALHVHPSVLVNFMVSGVIGGAGMLNMSYFLAALPVSASRLRLLAFRFSLFLIFCEGAKFARSVPVLEYCIPPMAFISNMKRVLRGHPISWIVLMAAFLVSTAYFLLAVTGVWIAVTGRAKAWCNRLFTAQTKPKAIETPMVSAPLALQGICSEPVANESLIELCNVDIRRRHHRILRNLSLNVYHGQSLGILSSNGNGKSLIIKLLSRLIAPDNGSVVQSKGHVKSVGVCFQEDKGFWDLTVHQNLRFLACARGASYFSKSTDHLVEQIADVMGLASSLNVKMCRLCHGDRRLLAMAMSIIGSPSLTLLDEPFNGLDLIRKQEMIRIVCMLNGLCDRTLVMTSINSEDLASSSFQLALLQHGCLISQSATQSFLKESTLEHFSLRLRMKLTQPTLLSKDQIEDREIERHFLPLTRYFYAQESPLIEYSEHTQCILCESTQPIREPSLNYGWYLTCYMPLTTSTFVTGIIQELIFLNAQSCVEWTLESATVSSRLRQLHPLPHVRTHVIRYKVEEQ